MASRTIREDKIPITIVPTRKLVEDKEVEQLKQGLRTVQTSIRGLQGYSEKLKSTPRRRTREDINREADKMLGTLEKMKLDSTPILGERFENEIEMIENVIAKAKKAAKEGDLLGASNLLKEAHAKITAVGEVFEVEMQLLLAGQPENIQVSGYRTSDEAFNAVLDGLEAALVDIGTANDLRGRNIIKVGKSLAKNAFLLSIDNDKITAQRNSAYLFIIERGQDAKERISYTKADARKDASFIGSLETNVPKIKQFMLDETIAHVRSWQISLQSLAAQNRNDEIIIRTLDRLQKDLDNFLKRAREQKKVNLDELRVLSLRYRTMTGTSETKSNEQIQYELSQEATRLRGKGPAKPGSREHFAQIALESLELGKTSNARLAVLMAQLQESSGNRGREYVPEFDEISAVLEAKADFTPGMASEYSRGMEVGLLDSEIDNISKKATGKKKERIIEGAEVARSRLMDGMIESAAKLIEMLSVYSEISGSKEIEEAIDLEIKGKDGTAMFDLGFKKHQFQETLSEMKKNVKGWKVPFLRKSFERIEGLIAENRITEAQLALTMTAMYADSVMKVGKMKDGKVVSVPADERLGLMEEGILEGNEKQFMTSFNALQYTHIVREAERLGALAQKRDEGGETVLGALEAAKKRAKEGNFNGANQLILYVEDFYGKEENGKKEGWRYRLAGARGIDEGKMEMLEGIRMETVSLRFDTSQAAAARFDSGSRKIALTTQLLAEHRMLEQKLLGNVPFIAGQSDTKGKIPLGERANGRYPDYVAVAEVRREGKLNPAMKRLREAAESGNITLFNREAEAINSRLQNATAAVVTKRNLKKARSQVEDIRKAIGEMQDVVGNARNLSPLRKRADGILADIKRGELDFEEYAAFLQDVSMETRIAKGFAVLKGQIELNEQYRKVVDVERGDIARDTSSILRDAGSHLKEARRLLAAGDLDGAMREYQTGISRRTDALLLYRAENSPSWRQVMSLRPGGTPRESNRMGDTDLRFFSQYTAARASEEYAFYRDAHLEAFSKILNGSATTEEINRIGHATTMVEASVFSIPQSTPAGLITDFVPDQKRVLASAQAMIADPAIYDRAVAQAEGTLQAMQTRLENNKFAINASLCVTGVATAFIPGIGVYVSGTLFTGMAIDRIATEYRVDGHASTEAWAMLGLTIASVGLFAAASRFAALSRSAGALGATNHALRFSRIATGMHVANFGIALTMSGVGGYHAYRAFQRGDYKNGVLLTGMSIFPWVVTGISIARSRPSALRANARELSPENLGREITIEVEEPPPTTQAREIATPQRLFNFLRAAVRMDPGKRAEYIAKLPRNVSQKVTLLLENEAVMKAVESGNMDRFTETTLFKAIKTFDLEPTPPSGPKGTRFGRDLSFLVNSREALREFVASLLIPDDAPAPALRQRAAARAKLADMRQKSARAGAIIDDLVNNAAVRDAIESGNDTAFSNRALDLAIEGRARGPNQRPGLRELVGPDEVAAEAAAAQEYVSDMVVGSDLVPQRGPGEATVAQEGGTTTGIPVQPGQSQTVTAQPGQPINVTVQQGPGLAGRLYNWASAGVTRFRANRQAREQAATETPNIDHFTGTSKRQLNEMAELTVDPAMHQATIERLAATATPEELPILAQNVRYGANRFAYMMKALYQRANSRGVDGAKRQAARAAMAKIYSYANVRAVLEQMSMTDPELANAMQQTRLSVVGGARRSGGQGVPVENFLAMKSREGFSDAEVLTVVETIEARAAGERNQLIGQLTELENNVLPRLQSRLTQETNALARKGKKPETSKKVGDLQAQILQTRARIQQLREKIHDPENQPLSASEEAFGVRFTSGERAPMIERLIEVGLVHPETIITESMAVRNAAAQKVEEVPVAIIRSGGTETQHVVGARFRELLAAEVRDGTSATAEEAILKVLRSDRMAQQVERSYDATTRDAYARAVAEGNLAQVVNSLRAGQRIGSEMVMMEGIARGLVPTIERANTAIAGDFTLMATLGQRASEIGATGNEGIGIAGERMMPVGERVAYWWQGSNIRGAWRFLVFEVPEPGGWRSYWPRGESGVYKALRLPDRMIGSVRIVKLHTAGFRSAARTYATTQKGEAPLERAMSVGYAGLNLALLGVEAYYLNKWYGDKIWDVFTNSSSIQEGIAIAKRDYGVDISEDNALWLLRDGKEFYYTLTTNLPVGSQRRPGSREEFEAVLNKGGVIYNPYRLDEILSDGKTMEKELPRLNRLLASGDPQAIEILRSWGIDEGKLNGRTKLSMAELVVLKEDNWRARGLVANYADVVASQFCVDAGIIPLEEVRSGKISERGLAAVNFLTENKDVFAILWDGVQKGHIAVAHFDEAISYLQSEGTISGIRAVGQENFDETLIDALRDKGYYLQTPIKQGSFLYSIDRFGDYATVRRLIAKYGNNPEAMEAFNKFVLLTGEFGESIYGNPDQLAEMIIADPKKALIDARKMGMVAPQRLIEIDPRIRNDPGLVRYILDHSQISQDGKQSKGMLEWIKDNEHRTQNHVKEIVEYVRSIGAIDQLDVGEVEKYMDRQTEIFSEKGWWTGATPAEARAESDKGRKVKGARPRKVPRDREKMTKEELLAYETEAEYPRGPGFEGKALEGRKRVGMSAEEREFFSTEAGFSKFIDERIDSMFEDVGPDGMEIKGRYGADEVKEEVAADKEPTKEDGENRRKAKEEVKAEIYRLLTSDDPKDKAARERIMKTGEGGLAERNVEIEIGGKKYSYNTILSIDPMRKYIFEFIMNKNDEARARGEK